jgi:hypothetical protein
MPFHKVKYVRMHFSNLKKVTILLLTIHWSFGSASAIKRGQTDGGNSYFSKCQGKSYRFRTAIC